MMTDGLILKTMAVLLSSEVQDLDTFLYPNVPPLLGSFHSVNPTLGA